jgi:hypothetical protein
VTREAERSRHQYGHAPQQGIVLLRGGSRLLAVVSNTITFDHRRVTEGVAKGNAESNQRAQSQGSHI